jgi:hypothetical protein
MHMTHSKLQVQAQLLLCRQRKHTVASEQCALTCSERAYLKIIEIWAKKVVVSCVNFILAVDLGIKLLVNILSLLLFYEKVKRPYKVQSLCKLLQQILLLLQCVI